MRKIVARTTNSSEIITLEEIKLHLRVDIDDDDDLLEIYKIAAISLIEKECNINIFQCTYDEGYCCARNEYYTTSHNVNSVASLKYYNEDNTITTIDSSNYIVYTPVDRPAIITMKHDWSWPATYRRQDAVIIQYSVGASTMPDLLKAAILLQIGTWYETRENENSEKLSSLEFGTQRIINIYNTFVGVA